VYIELGLYQEAISDFNSKLQLIPGDAEDYFARSKLHKMVGDLVRAAEDYEKALAGKSDKEIGDH
jgi:tetratricopeptide (TPR) repeat protein